MIFSSFQYFIFLPAVILLYWRTTGGVRLTLLVAASYFFYMSWLPVYGLLLFLLTCANWLFGLLLGWARERFWRSAFLTIGLTINLGCLFFYKYANFLVSNLTTALQWVQKFFGISGGQDSLYAAPLINVLLPLGISFFVFEFIHYLVDIYRGSKPISSWMEFAAFAAFFPSQIAGPIKRYQDFSQRLNKPEPLTQCLFSEGMTLIVQGLVKKIVLADPIGAIVSHGFTASAALSCPDALIAAIGFVIQVYCDFSGYTDIGRGSALLLGIRLPENFQLPYLSHDLADFWRRWHMSLSYWLRDYLYIPLGGSKHGRLATWRNLFITMTVCGLWHGAAWHYVIFGCMQGIGLIVNRQWCSFLSCVKPLDAAFNTWIGRQLGTFITMSFITISFVVFRAPDMPHALSVLSGLSNLSGTSMLAESICKAGVLQFLAIYVTFWLTTELFKQRKIVASFIWDASTGYKLPVRMASWTMAVILMIAAKPTEITPFVYFQF
ncbi:MAG: MBOAT family protein [Candidatus Melainabacteria bacterium]|nr:MBOAT family protein [Candidatus Melainabacteria bacterium]